MYIICNNLALHVVNDPENFQFHYSKLLGATDINPYISVHTEDRGLHMFKSKTKWYTDVVYKIAEEIVFGDSTIEFKIITQGERDHLWQNTPGCSWREFAMMKDFKVINTILEADRFQIENSTFRKKSIPDMMILLYLLKGEYKDINRIKFCKEEEFIEKYKYQTTLLNNC